MKAKLQKWGNSVGVRIPSNIIKELKWGINDALNIEEQGGKIIITKKNNLSLEERFKKYSGENLSEDFNWDEPQGKEIW